MKKHLTQLSLINSSTIPLIPSNSFILNTNLPQNSTDDEDDDEEDEEEDEEDQTELSDECEDEEEEEEDSLSIDEAIPT